MRGAPAKVLMSGLAQAQLWCTAGWRMPKPALVAHTGHLLQIVVRAAWQHRGGRGRVCGLCCKLNWLCGSLLRLSRGRNGKSLLYPLPGRLQVLHAVLTMPRSMHTCIPLTQRVVSAGGGRGRSGQRPRGKLADAGQAQAGRGLQVAKERLRSVAAGQDW